MTPADRRLMSRAVALARRGEGSVHPNPMVGCVLAKEGRIVGEGYHARYGGPHAEPRALRRAGGRARGATAYVTLEPCCYHGKTPACTEALISAGVREVVAATVDPNPRVAGKGLKRLRRAGIRVRSGILEGKAAPLLADFSFWLKSKRPRVTLKAAASLDGRTETAAGDSKWITSKAARDLSRRMRSEFDAILAGVETVLADDPRLTASGGRNPLRVILDSRLRSPKDAKVFRKGARTLVATAASPRAGAASPNGPFPAGSHVSWVKIPKRGRGLDLKRLLKELSLRGVRRLLVEGGSAVHTAFLEQGLVDEVRLFLAPRLIGGERARSFFEGKGFAPLARSIRLEGMTVRPAGEDLLISARVGAR